MKSNRNRKPTTLERVAEYLPFAIVLSLSLAGVLFALGGYGLAAIAVGGLAIGGLVGTVAADLRGMHEDLDRIERTLIDLRDFGGQSGSDPAE